MMKNHILFTDNMLSYASYADNWIRVIVGHGRVQRLQGDKPSSNIVFIAVKVIPHKQMSNIK